MNNYFEIILAPFISLLIVQSIKLATDGIKGNFNFKEILTAYGGMPSAHTAVVTSLSSMVALTEGLRSAAFAIAAIFSVIVISDAITLRKHVDNNGKAIQALVNRLSEAERRGFPPRPMNIEHTLPQVLVGGLIGLVISFLIYLL